MANETGAVPDPERVADQLAIQHVLAQHSRGVDRADGKILESAYWPDAEVAYGGFNGKAHDFCAMLPDAIRQFAHTQHSISNFNIEFHGDEARVETYVRAIHYTANAAGADHEMAFFGRYLDRMAKRDGVWKILHRTVVMDWNRHDMVTAVWDGPPFDGLARGGRHPEDPLYAHLESGGSGDHG